MDLQAIGEIYPQSSVLLLGSGFSIESVNLRGKSPPTGGGLRRHFIQELKLELFHGMLSEESHRGFAIRVLEGLGPFVAKRRGDLTAPEKVALVFWMAKIVDTLERLPMDFRVRTGCDATKRAIESAKAGLV